MKLLKRIKRKTKGAPRGWKLLFYKVFLGALSLGIFLGAILVFWASTLEIPDFGSFEERKVAQSTKIYDRTGEILLNNIASGIRRKVVNYDEISRHVKNATVAIEDAEFYQHKGIKPTAIIRAFLANIVSGGIAQGGSTISQQVIKNTVLTGEKKYSRKIKEAILALKLETVLSKDKILLLYLNEAPYGGNIYGVEEAALVFFGKKASEVSIAEAAYLAALPQAPTYYSPYGENVDKLNNRKNLVLKRMAELGFISEEEQQEARKDVVSFLPPEDRGIKAPHFVFYVRSYLEKKYGKDVLETGGLKVITTLDWEAQKRAEELVKEYATKNEENFNASNAGVVGLDPKTGQVLVMVGSRDYFEEKYYSNFNVTLAHRQPGSAFKPIVYAAAMNKGYTPETILFDLKTQFSSFCDAEGKPKAPNTDPGLCYTPGNYDNVFRGPVTIREALAQSINVPAVKALYLVGLRDALKTARDLGIRGLIDPNQYGLTLVLGGGEVSLLELTGAYGVFANNGERNPVEKILRIEDSEGDILESFVPRPSQVLPENTARIISDILSDNEARTPAFGSMSPLYFPGRPVAAKTGTTNDYRDAWIVGYTPSFVLGAWAGNNDNTPMEKKVAGFVVAPMWHAVFDEVLKSLPVESFEAPEPINKNLKPVLRGFWQGGANYVIDKISGKLATEFTPEETKEERVLTDIHSILYWLDKDKPSGKQPQKPEQDPQFLLWEEPVAKWAQTNGYLKQGNDTIPTQKDDVHKPEFQPRVSVTSPSPSMVYPSNSRINVSFSAQGKYPLSQADFYLNGVFLGSSKTQPFDFAFVPADVFDLGQQNEMQVVVYDSVRNKTEVRLPLLVSF